MRALILARSTTLRANGEGLCASRPTHHFCDSLPAIPPGTCVLVESPPGELGRLQPAQPAAGGRRDDLIRRDGAAARPSTRVSNEPPAALRAAVPAEAGVPSRMRRLRFWAPRRGARARRRRYRWVQIFAGLVIAGCKSPPAPLSLGANPRRLRYRWVQTPAGPVIAGCKSPPASLSMGANPRRLSLSMGANPRRSSLSLGADPRRLRYRWVQIPAGLVIAGCKSPPASLSLGADLRRPRYRWVQISAGPVIDGCKSPPAPLSLGANPHRPRYRWVQIPAGPAIAGCKSPPAPLSLGANPRRPRYRWVQIPAGSVIAGCKSPPASLSLGADPRRLRYRWVQIPAGPVIAGCKSPPAPLSLGANPRRPRCRCQPSESRYGDPFLPREPTPYNGRFPADRPGRRQCDAYFRRCSEPCSSARRRPGGRAAGVARRALRVGRSRFRHERGRRRRPVERPGRAARLPLGGRGRDRRGPRRPARFRDPGARSPVSHRRGDGDRRGRCSAVPAGRVRDGRSGGRTRRRGAAHRGRFRDHRDPRR